MNRLPGLAKICAVLVIVMLAILVVCFFRVDHILEERKGLREQVELQKDYLIGAEDREALLSEKVSEAERVQIALRAEIDVAQKALSDALQQARTLALECALKDNLIASLSTLAAHRRHKLDVAEKEIARLKALLQKELDNSLADITRRVAKEKEADHIMQQQIGSIAKEIAAMKAALVPPLRPAR